jgi:hypothetical protein
MNPRIFVLAVGVAIGYIVGARAGRARYDEMAATVSKLWRDPRVRKVRTDVESYARQQAPVIRERAEALAAATPGFAKDVADRTAAAAKDVADRTAAAAKDVADRTTAAAKDAADRATKTVRDARDRGEAVVDRAVATVGKTRDGALAQLDDADDEVV